MEAYSFALLKIRLLKFTWIFGLIINIIIIVIIIIIIIIIIVVITILFLLSSSYQIIRALNDNYNCSLQKHLSFV